MTNWQPVLTAKARPKYRAIVAAIEEAIKLGELRAGDRLPTHRDLAWRLGVTVGTVTRAYRDATQRGYLVGEVGRGTFVRPADIGQGILQVADAPIEGRIDLSINQPPSLPELRLALRELAGDGGAADLLRYQPPAGRRYHRDAGSVWLQRVGLQVPPDEIVVTVGAQHGLLVALAALARPGDGILTEKLTYPAIKPLASVLGLRLHGLEMDEQGVTVEAVAGAIRAGKGRVLYCTPNLHNPTAAIMSAERREQLAALARETELMIIEDDVYGLLLEQRPPPLAHFVPGQTVFVTGLSKTIAPGLRVGFVRAPRPFVRRISYAVRCTTCMAPPLTAEIAARWIHNGQADRFVAAIRQEVMALQAVFRSRLGHIPHLAHSHGPSVWLQLPDPWRAQEFVAAAAERGVAVTHPDLFVMGRGAAPHAVRLCLGSATTRAELDTALLVLADLLAADPIVGTSVI